MKPMSVPEIVDRIGTLKAQLVPIAAQLKVLENALKEKGAGRYSGVLWDATVSSYNRETLDMDAVRAKLSAQFIVAHTRETPVVKITMNARLPIVKAA
jgi:hypothetical protein